MATQKLIVDELIQVVKSVKNHKRYSLRSTTIASILVGSALNCASLLAVFVGGSSHKALRHLIVWTSIVLSISFLWNCTDLASHSDRIFKQKQLISVNVLVFVDTLGFLSFLALLIANGIIVDHMHRGPTILLIYNSVPWMFCCAIHGFVALVNMPSIFFSMGHGSTCCRKCHHKAKRQETRGKEGNYEPLLEREGGRNGYQDLEANEASAAV